MDMEVMSFWGEIFTENLNTYWSQYCEMKCKKKNYYKKY